MSKLFVRAALTDFDETELVKDADDLSGFEDRQLRHFSAHFDQLRSDEFGFDVRLTIFEEHGHDFAQIRVELVQRFRLRVRSRKTGDGAHEQAGLGRALYNGGVGFHAAETDTRSAT